MNKEILLIVDSISNEKNMEKELIFHAIEVALETITINAKRYEPGTSIRVAINQKTGDYETFRRWTVVEDATPDAEPTAPELVAQQITLKAARAIDSELDVGDIVEEPVESVKFEFGRIAAQQARQIIMREIRIAERNKIVSRLKEQTGYLFNGVVKKITRDSVLLDLEDGMEGFMQKDDFLPREAIHMNDRVRAILKEVKSDRKGTLLHLSRTCPEMLVELFKLEVPEINEEVIEVKAVARDAGSRAKMAVKTNDGRIDPIGACIGIRGSRVQAVSNELGGEKIDIILWDADPAQLAVNAMSPAEIVSIVVDENSRNMDIVVKEENLAQAIGRNGQNVRLASELTKWRLNVLTVAAAEKKSKVESGSTVDLFVRALDVDTEVAEILAQEGFRSLEDIAYSPLTELTSIEDFDEEIAEALRDRARDVLLEQALDSKETLTAGAEPAKDLLEMEGMSRHLAYVLAGHGIITREDLAEQSVDELCEIKGLNEKRAAELIMTARKPWFEKKGKRGE
jgi:transcription termination/antitermination protein NusA